MSDVHGYYAALGVESSASASEIKSAYRKLAKDYHPDSGFNRDGGATFRFITEAYAVLSDSRARSDYDGLANQSKTTDQKSTTCSSEAARQNQEKQSSAQAYDPIRCEICQKFAAQPRRIAFWNVTSLLLYSNRSPVQKIFCAKCAGKQQLKSTFWTGLIGWWGVPWGPVWSTMYGIQNVLGGARDSRIDDALAWNNVLAFVARGEFKLAAGIANFLKSSTNPEIAGSANQFIVSMRSKGIDTGIILGDVWHQSAMRMFALLAALFCAPAAVAYAIMLTVNSSATSTNFETNPVNASNGNFWETNTQSSSISEKANQTLPNAKKLPIHLCEEYPENGAILKDHRLNAGDGHILTIENGTAGDAVVKIRDAASGKSLVSFFVATSSSADLKGIPDGTYRIQYGIGKLDKSCKRLIPGGSANEFPESETLSTTVGEGIDGTSIERGHLTYTLFSVPNGNVKPSGLTSEEFEAE